MLRGWFDTRDPSTRTVTSGRISALKNKVSGVNASEVSGNGPALGTTLNGGPCLVGTGSNFLRTTESALVDCAAASGGQQASTVIWLFEATSPSFGASWGWGDPTEAFASQYFSGGQGITRNESGTQTQWAGANSTGWDDPVSVSQGYPGAVGTPSLRRDCVDQSMALTVGTEPRACGTPTHFTLMARSRLTTDPLVGLFGVALIYSGLLSTGNQDLGMNGIRSWWGLPRI